MIPLDIKDKIPVCPDCGNCVIGSTLVDYGAERDLNHMWCDECGYSTEAYRWKTYIKIEED